MNIGSVVNMKIGGTLMTVESIDENTAKCVWFIDCKIYRDTFNIMDLQEWVKVSSCG